MGLVKLFSILNDTHFKIDKLLWCPIKNVFLLGDPIQAPGFWIRECLDVLSLYYWLNAVPFSFNYLFHIVL